PAAAEPSGDDALVVAAALLRLGLQERLLRPVLLAVGQVGEIADRALSASRRRRLVLTNAHVRPSCLQSRKRRALFSPWRVEARLRQPWHTAVAVCHGCLSRGAPTPEQNLRRTRSRGSRGGA